MCRCGSALRTPHSLMVYLLSVWSRNNPCDPLEQILQGPRQSGVGQPDGGLRVYLEQMRLEFRVLALNPKVDTKKSGGAEVSTALPVWNHRWKDRFRYPPLDYLRQQAIYHCTHRQFPSFSPRSCMWPLWESHGTLRVGQESGRVLPTVGRPLT